MKVAHLTTVDLSLRYLVLPQLLAVIDEGGEALGISAPGPWVEEIEARGVRHVPLESSTRGMDLLADLRATVQLWRILRRERPDVLHTHNPKPGLYGRVVGRLAGVPIVVNTVHGLYATPDDPIPKRAIVYVLEAVASRFSDEELVQNPEDLELLARWHISPPGRTSLLGNGVDIDRFDPERFDQADRDSVRADLGITDDQILVGFVGRLVEEKGLPELFEAMGRLDDRHVLVCIGPHDPEKADALPEALVERARANGVRFLGMRTDVDELYAAMDLFALPSHREGFPRAAMEAAASGLPVIATDIRGCRQVVDPGVTGLLVPLRDPMALADAIESLGSDSERRARMGLEARRRAEAHFDESDVVRRVMAAYERVARRRGLTHLVQTEPIDPGQVAVRPAIPSDVPFLADLHARAIETGFLPTLGRRFMRALYSAMVGWAPAVVLVAEVGPEDPIGFVAGVPDTGGFYRHFVRRHGLRAAISALPSLLWPSVLRRAWESLTYGGGGSDVSAELLSMAVVEGARGRGVGRRLGSAFLETLDAPAVRVVVGADNRAAIGGYERMGFVATVPVEVHRGERSVEMVWSGHS